MRNNAVAGAHGAQVQSVTRGEQIGVSRIGRGGGAVAHLPN